MCIYTQTTDSEQSHHRREREREREYEYQAWHPGTQFTTPCTCFTRTKVQILTPEELLFVQFVPACADRLEPHSELKHEISLTEGLESAVLNMRWAARLGSHSEALNRLNGLFFF